MEQSSLSSIRGSHDIRRAMESKITGNRKTGGSMIWFMTSMQTSASPALRGCFEDMLEDIVPFLVIHRAEE
jgi:hypothetical protein